MIEKKDLSDIEFIETLKKNISNFFCKFCKNIGTKQELMEHIVRNKCHAFEPFYNLYPFPQEKKEEYLAKNIGFYIAEITESGIQFIENTLMQLHLNYKLDELVL